MSSQPNWDDFMTPDEMDEFEQWQLEQAEAAAVAGPAGPADADFEDIMDPADIPLCNEYAATGYCSAGEDCLYIHGDACEVSASPAKVVVRQEAKPVAAVVLSVAEVAALGCTRCCHSICCWYCSLARLYSVQLGLRIGSHPYHI
jgi:hypothetical protein